jgi:hypothetical protein
LPQKGPTEEPNASKASAQTLKFIETNIRKNKVFVKISNFDPRLKKWPRRLEV